MILFWVIQHRLHNSPMKLCFYYYYKHQADTEIPTPGKYGDMGTEDVPLRSAKRDIRVCLLLLNHQPRRNAIFLAIGFHEGTLKWKSHEMTKANTIQASRKFRNRCPCQQFWVSAGCTGAGASAATASFDSFHCSNSASFTPATLRATDPQISQVLQLHTGKKIIIKLQRNRLYRSYSKKNQAKQCNVLFQKMMVLVDQSEPNKRVSIYIFWKQVVGYNTNQFNKPPNTRCPQNFDMLHLFQWKIIFWTATEFRYDVPNVS